MTDNEKLRLTLIDGLKYGLNCTIIDKERLTPSVTAKLCGVYSDGTCVFHDLVESDKGFSEIKPHIRPMSDLANHITVEGYNEGKLFVPISEIEKYHFVEESYQDVDAIGCLVNRYGTIDESIRLDVKIQNMPWVLVDQLQKWHFNVYGLPESMYIKIQ